MSSPSKSGDRENADVARPEGLFACPIASGAVSPIPYLRATALADVLDEVIAFELELRLAE
jgi:hypothetical protein